MVSTSTGDSSEVILYSNKFTDFNRKGRKKARPIVLTDKALYVRQMCEILSSLLMFSYHLDRQAIDSNFQKIILL